MTKPTYKEFVDVCLDISGDRNIKVDIYDIDGSRLKKDRYYIDNFLSGYRILGEPIKESDRVYIAVGKWCIGGREGGTCFGDEATRYTTNERPNDMLPFITALIQKYKPDVSYLYVINNILPLRKEYEYQYNGYYGNYDEYGANVIMLKELYDIIFK